LPELPEVETIRSDLAPQLTGRRIVSVRVHKPDIVLSPTSPHRLTRALAGDRIVEVSRRAKNLLFRLESGCLLLTQVRMTGRFVLGPPIPADSRLTHVAAEFDLDDGRTLYYDDVRRLGGFALLTEEEWSLREARLGPEPLERGFTAKVLTAQLTSSRSPIKSVLLDQGRIAGIGNIYASEALHRAAIDPRRSARSLGPLEVKRLHRAIRAVLRDALAGSGTSLRDYRALNGRAGSFQNRLRVYGREGEPCRRCASAVTRIVQAGRSTYYCSGCQS
jgi:formamidopyrimidine-DNA glycosylase